LKVAEYKKKEEHMAQKSVNSCARCGVPIKAGLDLCPVCLRDATDRTTMIPCRACGAANQSNAPVCGECGAPFITPNAPASPASGITGRRAEMQVLLDCFEVCIEKRVVSGVTVTGDAGMGCSTLLEAFAEKLETRLPKRRIFSVPSREEDDIYAPLRHTLVSWFNLASDDQTVVSRMNLASRIGDILGNLSAAEVTEITHMIGFLAGVPFPDSPVLKAMEADETKMHENLKQALIRVLEADIAREPAVVIYDDLQKTSPQARKLLVEVFEEMVAVPCLCIVGGRPELKDIDKNEEIVHIGLEPLDNDVMGRLFEVYMPKFPAPPEKLFNAIIGRSNGNPGSMHQLCALLQETGVIDTSTEPWTADLSKLSKTDMPLNLVEAAKARIKRLDPRDRRVLEHAAVFGEVFWDEAIVALSRLDAKMRPGISAAQIWADDSDALTLSSCLDRLVERQFVLQLPDSDIKGSIKYAFTRSSVRKEIVAGLDKNERQRCHFLAAEWLSHVASRQGPFFHEAEAAHWRMAGEKIRAGNAFLSAARFARSRHLNVKAIKLFRKALDHIDERDNYTLTDAYHDLGTTYDLLGRYKKAEECFTEMLRHAWLLTHRGKAGAALNRIGRLYRARGDSAAAKAFLNRGMTLFKATGDRLGVAASLGDLGELAGRQGNPDRAFQLVSEALELERDLDNKPSIAVCLHRLGHIEAARASYTQAERYLEEALKIRREINDVGGTAQTLSTLAIILANRGDIDQAIGRWKKALSLAAEVGDQRMQAIVNNNLGEALRDKGELDESMAYFKACQEVVRLLDDGVLDAEVSRNIGILAQKMGDPESAKEYFNRSLTLAHELGVKQMEALAYRALGELLATTVWDTSQVGKEDQSELFFNNALAIFKEIGNDFEVARTLRSRGYQLLERGDVETCRPLLEEAHAILERLESKEASKVARTLAEIAEAPNKTRAKKSSPPAPPKAESGFISPSDSPGAADKTQVRKSHKSGIKDNFSVMSGLFGFGSNKKE
jgi:tetratricopeptide (TPR) repeat protein